jgi:hypothetical protein
VGIIGVTAPSNLKYKVAGEDAHPEGKMRE